MKCAAFCFRPDFRQFHLVKRFPYRSSFPLPLHFIGYQGARNRAGAVRRCNAGKSFKPWFFWWLGGAQPWKSDCCCPMTTDKGNTFTSEGFWLSWNLCSVSSNGSSKPSANECVLGILPCDPGAECVVSSPAHPAHSGVSSLTPYLCLHLTSSC